MSSANELQTAVYDTLRADADVFALTGGRVYDRVPESPKFPYIGFGTSDTREDDAECITGVITVLQIDVWSRYQGGWQECKDIMGATKKALHLDPSGSIKAGFNVHALVEARVIFQRDFPDPDGITRHGVVHLQAIMEEN